GVQRRQIRVCRCRFGRRGGLRCRLGGLIASRLRLRRRGLGFLVRVRGGGNSRNSRGGKSEQCSKGKMCKTCHWIFQFLRPCERSRTAAANLCRGAVAGVASPQLSTATRGSPS